MNTIGKAGRTAVYTAISILKSSGYIAEKVTGSSRRFDIIAWNRDKLIGFVIRRSRTKGIAGYSSLIAELAGLVQKQLFLGEIQVWLFQSYEWKRYQVLPGGAIEISGRLV